MPSLNKSLHHLHALTHGTSEVVIAILDTEIAFSHKAFEGSQLLPLTFSSNTPAPDKSHGTFVASIIFSSDTEHKGIAPDCSGLSLSIYSQQNGKLSCEQSDLAKAILAAADAGAHIINISGGILSPDNSSDLSLQKAVEECARRKIQVVAAVGNEGCDCLHVPASLPEVLAVGAVNEQGIPYEFNNYGWAYRKQGLLIPLDGVKGAVTSGGFEEKKASSYAAPVVSGILALLCSLQHKAGQPVDPIRAKNILFETADICVEDKPGSCQRFLAGTINIEKALALLQEELATITPNKEQASEAPKSIAGVGPTSFKPGSVQPSGIPTAPMVYALGSIGFDIGSQSLKDVLSSQLGDLSPATVLQALNSMGSDGIPGSSNNPNGNVQQLYYAQSLTWLLKVDEQPVYAIQPSGAFAREAYSLLRDFMSYQMSGNNSSLMRCSLPGRLSGSVQLNGQSLPVITPDIMGMHCWSVNELMADLLGNVPETKDKNKQQEYDNLHAGVVNFLERVYYSLRNKGQSSADRAINFAATNAFQVGQVFKNALQQGLALKGIQATPSAFGRPGADCQDVVMVFFNPSKVFEQARTVYRFTVDVTETTPVLAGPMRFWME